MLRLIPRTALKALQSWRSWRRWVRHGLTMQKGDLFRARLPKDAIGHEQRGVRYAVVLQASELELSTVIVAPTSTRALATSFRPEIQVVGQRTRVLTEQLRTVDRRRLGEPVGRLTWEELEEVDRALETVLGLAR